MNLTQINVLMVQEGSKVNEIKIYLMIILWFLKLLKPLI